jgi:DNA-binding response OmpR family regulator
MVVRLLVVEDEKRIADFLGRGLQGAGYAVDVRRTARPRCSLSTIPITIW